ncbi:class I SAM-dependent methyltransferase [Clostridium sp.]|uniref:class I SAM-dependent methyltransferase n=1 Tax=Clostridium sp. TaxID=1506 RepID=UPI003463E4D8
MLDSKGFDIWAKEYDKSVEIGDEEYPFHGYYQVLQCVYNLINGKESKKILDVGFGTGLLTNRLYIDGAKIYGMDFSQNMIHIAKEKMPKGIFIQWDFNLGVPSQLKTEKFDYIISSYAIHHLDNDKKFQFINELKGLLNEDGKIIIADVAFKTENELIKCKSDNDSIWDDEEIYMVGEEIISKLSDKGINSRYTQISPCAGILEIY